MNSATRMLLTAGIICGVLGVFRHLGLLAVTGVVLILAALLLRSLTPRPSVANERPRFGPTTVASTMPGRGRNPFDRPPHD